MNLLTQLVNNITRNARSIRDFTESEFSSYFGVANFTNFKVKRNGTASANVNGKIVLLNNGVWMTANNGIKTIIDPQRFNAQMRA